MTAAKDFELDPDGPRSPRYRFVIAGLVLFAHFSVGLNFFVVAPLLPLIIDHYQINLATASLLIALALLVHSFFGLPGGIIATRFGLKRMYFLSWLMIGLPVLSALAPNFVTLLMLRLVYGIGFGAIIPATAPLLMQWFRPREITIMNGLDIAALSLGVALSVSVAVPLAAAVGWQNTLSVFGGIALFGAAAWGVLGRAGPGTRSPSAGIPLKEVWSVLQNRTILLLVAADALVFMQYTALTSWLPTFYYEVRGMSLTQAGYVTGLLPFVGVFAVLAGGFLPLRFESRRPFFVVPGVLLGLGGLGSFLIDGTVGIYISVALLGIGSWSYAPTLLSLPMDLPDMTPERVAVVWGTFVTVSGAGMFVSPLVVGAIWDVSGSFVPGFMIFAVGAWFLVIAGLSIPKTHTKGHT
jgi:NNP family nitrate/nitrite transporter-like MFS transporter